MTTFDDTTLMAYVDGELDPETTAEVEAAAAADPELAGTIRAFRESTALARAAFNHVMYENAPALPRPRPRSPWRLGLAMAASLAALVVGGVAGHVATTLTFERQAAQSAAEASAMSETLTKALETMVSGTTATWRNPDTGSRLEVTPVRTFRIGSGQYCREFTRVRFVAGGETRDQGIACRGDDGGWRTRMQYYEG